MSSFDQVPFSSQSNFAAAEFADNPEPRCPCLLLLDNSRSMAGRPISELNAGLTLFKEELVGDALAAKRVEVGVVSFGPVSVVAGWAGGGNHFGTGGGGGRWARVAGDACRTERGRDSHT